MPCRIGASEQERAGTQIVWVNIELEFELPTADELGATVDYAALANDVKSFCANRSWKLIETMAADLADLVLNKSSALWVAVEVKKAALVDARFVSATVIRQRHTAT